MADVNTLRMMRDAVNALLNVTTVGPIEHNVTDSNSVLKVASQSPAVPMFPFKIYKPDLSTIANVGTIFDIFGNPSDIAINSTVPTNLPLTVNPTTDAWRIWAVREGLVSARSYLFTCFDQQFVLPGFLFKTTNSDFSTLLEVKGCDKIGIGQPVGVPYDFDVLSSNLVKVKPIILPFNFDFSGLYSIVLWIQVDMENITATLMGTRYQTLSGYQSAFPNPTDSSFIPVGMITSLGINFYKSAGDPKAVTGFNIQIGDLLSRYGSFQNNNGNSLADDLIFSATTNYRGDFLNDNRLADLVFYPGDIVKVEGEIDLTATSSGGILTTVTATIPATASSHKLFSQNLWMMTSVGFTTDPTTDPDWVKISGLDVSTQNNPTPNT